MGNTSFCPYITPPVFIIDQAGALENNEAELRALRKNNFPHRSVFEAIHKLNMPSIRWRVRIRAMYEFLNRKQLSPFQMPMSVGSE